MKKILIIDIETTGFLKAGGKIVEIGIVSLDLDSGVKEVLFNKVIHEKGITLEEVKESWIVKNSSLTPELIRYSPELASITNEVQNIIDSHPLGVTAYNNKFDFDFMEDRGFNFPVKLPCPMKLSTGVCKIPAKRGGYKWPKVQEAYDHFFGKTDYIEEHRGADDAWHEASIVYRLYREGVFKLN